jgi:hypothetical protein
MIKSLRFAVILILVCPKLYSFSEVTNKTLIHGRWIDKNKKIVMTFSDNNRLEVRIYKDSIDTRYIVFIPPKIMTGKYNFIARGIYTKVYDSKKKKNIVTNYRLEKYEADLLVLKNYKTKKTYYFNRDFTKTSQPKLSIANKLKKVIVDRWIAMQTPHTKKFQIIFFKNGQYSIRFIRKNLLIVGRYECYSNIIRLYQNNSLYNFYIAKYVSRNNITLEDKNSDWLELRRAE